ncbi:hypothetical protein GCM10007972_07520 [Iodidimonas muriae]|uniref:DUF4760 domain-containing protein n=1 Tax=Iodidimonas muriae TaxID=261467 RepID=A0ABQ2L9I9_9PROT|nr:hypothetical protein [Iodidimonas muriae]GGO07786.1 hypothetical protein GCM10007972_07520 [Iodidimonas muriae]
MTIDRIALLIIAASFLTGTYLASLDEVLVKWVFFVPVLLVGALGVVLLRRSRKAQASASHVLHGNRDTLISSLNAIVSSLQDFDAIKETLPTDQLRHEVDQRFRGHLLAFVEARESLSHLYGLSFYAQIMSSFAAGERYLNRVWSASTDGYGEEACAYISRALTQFREAQDVLAKVTKAA